MRLWMSTHHAMQFYNDAHSLTIVHSSQAFTYINGVVHNDVEEIKMHCR